MSGYVWVTPQMAEEILNKNTYNRPLRIGVVEKYTRDLIANEWMKNGSTIVIATDGTLLDGQHRLFAVCEAACQSVAFKGAWMMVVRDADKSVLPTIDTGIPRSYADYKKLSAGGNGHTFPYAQQVQAALRLAWWYDKSWPASIGKGRKMTPSHLELDEVLARYPHMPDMVGDVAGSDVLKKLVSSACLGFVYAMAAIKYPAEAAAWLEIIRTGDAPLKHPGRVLRERLMLARHLARPLERMTQIVFITKSWNAFAQGQETIGHLKWGMEELPPAIFGTKQYTGKLAARTEVHKRIQTATSVSAASAFKNTGKRRRPKKAV